MTPAAIRRELEDEYADNLQDQDDMPVAWFAIAQAQWECAKLQPSVLTKVSRLISTGRGLERWEEALEERQRVLTAYLNHLQEVNPNPRQRHKTPNS